MTADLAAQVRALAEKYRRTDTTYDPNRVSLSFADDLDALLAAQPAEAADDGAERSRDWHDPAAREAAGMGRDHDRTILEGAEEHGHKVVVVRCPHTVGLCYLTNGPEGVGEWFANLPCPCNDPTEIVANVVPSAQPPADPAPSGVETLRDAYCDCPAHGLPDDQHSQDGCHGLAIVRAVRPLLAARRAAALRDAAERIESIDAPIGTLFKTAVLDMLRDLADRQEAER